MAGSDRDSYQRTLYTAVLKANLVYSPRRRPGNEARNEGLCIVLDLIPSSHTLTVHMHQYPQPVHSPILCACLDNDPQLH